jgi:hypothetical protein
VRQVRQVRQGFQIEKQRHHKLVIYDAPKKLNFGSRFEEIFAVPRSLGPYVFRTENFVCLSCKNRKPHVSVYRRWLSQSCPGGRFGFEPLVNLQRLQKR